jgi:hypothetical protein
LYEINLKISSFIYLAPRIEDDIVPGPNQMNLKELIIERKMQKIKRIASAILTKR